MPRSNWKGLISFGLVSIPIVLYNSENTADKISFHQIDKRDNARIKYQRVNVDTGKEVPWEDIAKGYAYNKDVTIPVDEDELKKVAGDNARTITIESFVDKDSIHFIDIDKTYYLTPDKKGEKGYVILREALKKTKKIGIAKVIISTKEYVSALAYYNNALVLYILRYHDEIKPMSEFDFPTDDLKKYKVLPKEIEVADQLIKSMSTKWKPEQYKDEYQEIVHKWAENKINHKNLPKMAQRSHAKQPEKITNFVELLRKSLGENKKNKRSSSKTSSAPINKKSHQNKRASLH